MKRTLDILLNEKIYSIRHGDLKIKKFLGEGKFGFVEEMIHTPTNITFAVKVYKLLCKNKFA